jgi:CBS domain-containing protein
MGLNEKEQDSYEKFWPLWRETESIIWEWLESFHGDLLVKSDIERKSTSFVSALKLIKSAGLLESNLRQALYDLSQLRNLFAHNSPDKIYGVPTEDAIPLLVQVHHIVSQKNRALEHLGMDFPVVALNAKDPVIELLNAVKKYDYSQFPVIDNEAIAGVVTTNTLARWLASWSRPVSGDFLNEPIETLMPYVESFENFTILKKDISVLDFWAVSNPSYGEIPPKILILTVDGSKEGEIVRVATELDKLSLYRAVNPGEYRLG